MPARKKRYPVGIQFTVNCSMRTIRSSLPLWIADDGALDPPRCAWDTLRDSILHQIRGCTVCKQGIVCTMTCRMDPATRNAQLQQRRVKLFFTQLVC